MKNKIKELPYTAADWTFEALVVVLYQIIRLIMWLGKRLYRESKVKLTWKIAGVMTFLYLLIWASMTVFYIAKFNFFTVYANPVTKTYTEVERQNYFLRHENMLLKSRMQDLEYLETGLQSGDKKAVVEYIKIKFGENWKTAVAVFTAESGLRKNAIGDGHLAFIDNGVEYGKSYGIAQIRHLKGRPSPEWLLNAKNNIDYAYSIYTRQGGFQAWSAYTNGKYLSSL